MKIIQSSYSPAARKSSRQEYICRLFQSSFRKGKWSKPLDLGDPVNDGEQYPNPTDNNISGWIRQVLYFISDRPGGLVDRIYGTVSLRKEFLPKPVNLGKTINTPGNESSPYYDAVQKTLYFNFRLALRTRWV